ncbi:hypothetical protein EJ06DRAFT_470308 [Trichodelitschia bisporula]|uniref:Copper transport protein n=1 Tax=Trichodelitschia bisporula TaxID=703511 RepID=A0A6G1I8X2_9PEZI|nr:hypothetical protein EJ06DRAFT_470308 [Trichodelitschia bisporula]
MTMDASDMKMTFFTSPHTPLYSQHWTPNSTGSYAGTCIFLIALAGIFRALLVYKHILEKRWIDKAWDRRFVVVADKASVAEKARASTEPNVKTALLTANGVEEEVKVVHRPVHGVVPWRWSVDGPRACVVTVIVGVGYLLMLAVMTLNVGYFLSILGGTFLGELLLGRYNLAVEEHH